MKTIILCTLTVLIFPCVAGAAGRRIDMSFEGQMASAVEELKEKMKADPDIDGRKLRLGRFSGPNLPDSTFDAEFEQTFKELMAGFLADESPLVVNGVYRFLPGELNENEDLHVIQFAISIERKFRKLQTVTREVNRSADIAKITGTTVALPDTTDVERRNKSAFEAVAEPQFEVRDQFFVTAKGHRDHAVAIVKKAGGGGKPVPLAPRNVNGFAFVDLDVTDTFEIVLSNYDARCHALAVVTIDGLDVATTFCEDKAKCEGYVVPRATDSRPGRHFIPGWLRTTSRSKGNVFEFVVNELGKGAATEMKSRHKLGVIHVEFYEAVPPGEELPSRSFGEVGKGRPLDVSYEVQTMQRRESPIASVSIRYRNAEREE